MEQQHSIIPLFCSPVYLRNIGDFQKPDLGKINLTSQSANGTPLPFITSENKHLLDDPQFSHIHDLIKREIETYTRDVLRVSRNIEFYITNSWINIYKKGYAAGGHNHSNSVVSGVLYLQAPEHCGKIVFHKDVNSLVPFPASLDLDVDEYNFYTCKSWGHQPKTNDICLFPSGLMHSVEQNQTSEERICLAFNVFIKGEFGGDHFLDLK